MQIAAYQRKRTVRHIFFGVCSENVYLCLQQRPFKWQPVPSPNRFIRLSSPVHDTKNGYDLVTQLRFHLAFCRFPLALPFFADTYLKAFFTALSPYFALFLSLLAFFCRRKVEKEKTSYICFVNFINHGIRCEKACLYSIFCLSIFSRFITRYKAKAISRRIPYGNWLSLVRVRKNRIY